MPSVVLEKYNNGSLYFGQMIDNFKQGQGIMAYSNGVIYYGVWNNNKKH